jgi:hypothetical protein
MQLPIPGHRNYSTLINDIENGQIKIPQFQREFVWELRKSCHLIDSIIKGYPIGTFILWRTNERLRSVRNLGNINLPETKDGEYVDYVLDGQQRLTSLYASFKGVNIARNGRLDNFANIHIDLNASEEEQIALIDIEDKDPSSLIKLIDLVKGDFTLLANFDSKYHVKLKDYKQRIEGYSYSIVQINNAAIDVATEVFTRLNVGGKALTLFEIMVAKTYDEKRNFDLSEKFDELIKKLSKVKYDTISNATVLQIMALVLTKECSRKEILKINKADFIDIWETVVDAILRTIDYLRSYYRIPVSELLPYNALVAPFAYFFYFHKDKPTGNKQKYLEDFFWRCALTGRYSSGTESKLGADVKKIDSILNDELPKYEWSVNTTEEFIINNGWFSAGRSFIKAILCLFAYHQPKSFNDGSIVNINNEWLIRANSKNYHHFFPRAFLKKQEEPEFYINHVLNITLVDDYLNKREIKAKAPSVYMANFKKKNPKLEETMKTHLIMDMRDFGIWNDDYDTFLANRASIVRKELESRIIPQETDQKLLAVLPDEEVEIDEKDEDLENFGE